MPIRHTAHESLRSQSYCSLRLFICAGRPPNAFENAFRCFAPFLKQTTIVMHCRTAAERRKPSRPTSRARSEKIVSANRKLKHRACESITQIYAKRVEISRRTVFDLDSLMSISYLCATFSNVLRKYPVYGWRTTRERNKLATWRLNVRRHCLLGLIQMYKPADIRPRS